MKNILIGFLSVLLVSCYESERNCEAFKMGRFKSEIVIKGVKKTVFFIRTKDLQVETFEGRTDSLSIRWVNDCEFVTRKLRPRNMAEEKSYLIRIVSTTKESYLFEFSEVGKSKKITATAVKI